MPGEGFDSFLNGAAYGQQMAADLMNEANRVATDANRTLGEMDLQEINAWSEKIENY
jgi:hypothetical protein